MSFVLGYDIFMFGMGLALMLCAPRLARWYTRKYPEQSYRFERNGILFYGLVVMLYAVLNYLGESYNHPHLYQIAMIVQLLGAIGFLVARRKGHSRSHPIEDTDQGQEADKLDEGAC